VLVKVTDIASLKQCGLVSMVKIFIMVESHLLELLVSSNFLLT